MLHIPCPAPSIKKMFQLSHFLLCIVRTTRHNPIFFLRYQTASSVSASGHYGSIQRFHQCCVSSNCYYNISNPCHKIQLRKCRTCSLSTQYIIIPVKNMGSNSPGTSGTLPEFQSKNLSRRERLISLLLSRKLCLAHEPK